MDYFHRRNKPPVEYSGHEDVSWELRKRVETVHDEFVTLNRQTGYWLRADKLHYLVSIQFPKTSFKEIILNGQYDQVFTVVEILHDYSGHLDPDRQSLFRQHLAEAFRLSGSVYALRNGRICLIPSEQTAAKLTEVHKSLSAFPLCQETFFTGVGDLMGRKRKPPDVVKDLFIGVEGYFKAITGENDYGAALKALSKTGTIGPIQRSVMDKLYGYRSDAQGVGHAGNTPTPTEIDALWFLDTMLAQLIHVDRTLKSRDMGS